MAGMAPKVLLALVALQVAAAKATEGSVYCNNHGICTVEFGKLDPKATAMGTYNASFEATGWDELEITTNKMAPGDHQAFGAGFLEAALTNERMWTFWNNFLPSVWGIHNSSTAPKPLVDYFMANNKYMNKMVSENPKDAYWVTVGYSIKQMEGMQAGYAAHHAMGNDIEPLGLQMLVASGDMFELSSKFGAKHPGQNGEDEPKAAYGSKLAFTVGKKDPWPVILQRLENGHCSALYKMMDDLSDVYFGHTAWFVYNVMMRMLKTYNFNYPGVMASSIKMSSYPGMITSFDDFYITSSGLSTIETSLGFMNRTLYDYIKPEGQVPYWVRIMVANRLANSPKHWSETFAMHNSGTYNNQWMVLNISAFKKGYSLPAGSFYVLEQLPGPYVAYGDQTSILNFDHWPSYNLPFYPLTYDVAGYPEEVKKYGPLASYSGAPRAKIFRRDAGKVESFKAFQDIMRYNDFEHDPFSGGNGAGAIAARADLTPGHPQCFGGYDSKASSATMWAANFGMTAQNGPTYNQQPVFKFSTTKAKCYSKLKGMPDEWHFPWVSY